jgi:hypothetical protein
MVRRPEKSQITGCYFQNCRTGLSEAFRASFPEMKKFANAWRHAVLGKLRRQLGQLVQVALSGCDAREIQSRLCHLMRWSGRAPAPPAIEAGERRPAFDEFPTTVA